MTNCLYCGSKLVPIGKSRSNGKDHEDWTKRKLHKKCFKSLSWMFEDVNEEVDYNRISNVDNLLCSFNGCNDLLCECRKCKLCPTRIPKDIALCKGDLCLNCHIDKWVKEQ